MTRNKLTPDQFKQHKIDHINKLRKQGKLTGMTGKKHSEETKRKMSESHKGRRGVSRYGKDNPNWKGGKPRCIDCGKEVYTYGFKRCQSCSSMGNLNPSWEGGRVKFREALRLLSERTRWINAVLERDDYTCNYCGSRNGDKHVHHIKKFSEILSEFLDEYNQFSIEEDRETLLRLAFKYKPFWDVANGKTLCIECHREEHCARREDEKIRP